jgi:uncharacterized membrane protein HdeD (DUF308 family)
VAGGIGFLASVSSKCDVRENGSREYPRNSVSRFVFVQNPGQEQNMAMPNRLPLSFAMRAIVAIVFGLVMLIFPQRALTALVFGFALFVVLEGLVVMTAALFTRRINWILFFSGLLSIAVGIYFLFWPIASVGALVIFIAAWMVLIGALVIATAIQQRRFIERAWVHVLAGFLPIVFGLWLLVWPFLGLEALAYMIGGYAFAWGVLLLWTAYELGHIRNTEGETGRGAA